LYKSSNVLDGVASLELLGKWMFWQRYARLLLIRLQGRLEKFLKSSGPRLAIHVKNKEEMRY
jgi:hypothetical protein